MFDAAPDRVRSSLKRREVAGRLREAILSGEHPTGSLLPGENELARRFSVSRSTIRGALEGLARDNLIETQTGIGSFVTFDGRALSRPRAGASRSMTGVHTRAEIVRWSASSIPTWPRPWAPGRWSSWRWTDPSLHRRRDRGLAGAQPGARGRGGGPGSGARARRRLAVRDDDRRRAGTGPRRPVDRGRGAGRGRRPPARPRAGRAVPDTTRIARDADGGFVEKVVSWLDPTRFRLHVSFGAGR